ncbi:MULTISPECIES: Nramp family divalent metal transporter [Phyllobacterium]|uniref:Nramp family divalent metal transporter n=1 Tax=Phyllobacterium TaxID=28100 RepID=UPI001CC18DE0|nr:Nramp family divalent metal transporter [Phyllobacterium calauticae]MBZ3695525.1 Nramp family divalent metal transporter [Phyllobacterium calauticae]
MDNTPDPEKDPVVGTSKPRLLAVLGPGLITGAADDDPSGIATYSQAGAQLGFAITWTMLFSYPLMAAIQEISARIGRTTGNGIATNLRTYYPPWILPVIVALLFIANAINIGADLGAMGEAVALLIGGKVWLYVIAFAIVSTFLQIFLQYTQYVSVLKWLTFSLFAYFGTVIFVQIPYGELARGFFIPTLSSDKAFWTTVVAILGTTISPYLFFWQASQEVEDEKTRPTRQPLIKAPDQAKGAIRRIRIDTYVGMGFSSLVALAIMVTTAATLHAAGQTDIETSAQAAEALKPIAGEFAFAIFALGIIGTGLLAIPVLAGSAAYALGEARRWPVGLARKPLEAKAFYATLAAATLIGTAVDFSPIDPIKALFWSAVINGVVSVPVMVMMMLMTARKDIMKENTVRGPLQWVGWLATAVMGTAVIGMGITSFL